MPYSIAKLLEELGSFFKLEDKLTSLSLNRPILAGLVILILIMVGGSVVISKLIELYKKFFDSWIHSRAALATLASCIVLAAMASAGIVLNLRRATEPVPVFILPDSDTVVGRPLLLNWTYDHGSNPVVRYAVESAADKTFRTGVTSEGITDGSFTVVRNINAKRFFRVRALDADQRMLSGWSQPLAITQFDSSKVRIINTRHVEVYISNEFNEGIFKFVSNDRMGTLKGFDIALAEEIVKSLPSHLNFDGVLTYSRTPMPFADLLDMLNSGRADMVIASISSHPARERRFGIKFSQPYFCTTQSLIFPHARPNKPIRDIIVGKRIGIPTGTASENLMDRLAQEMPGQFQLFPFGQTVEMIDAIAKASVDAGVTDTPFAILASLQYPNNHLEYQEFRAPDDFPKGFVPNDMSERYAVAIRAGESELLQAIDEIIDEMRAERLRKLYVKGAIAESW
jgi:ABC-type amino acid transport substrate-binding protein